MSQTGKTRAPLATDHANDSVWLLKVPGDVAEKIRNACSASSGTAEGVKIGAIRIPTNPSDPVKIDLTQLGVDPAEWEFKKDPLGPTLHLLSDSGGELEVTGRVAARFSLKRPADEAAGVSYMVDRFKKAKERENVGVSVIREMEPEDGRIRGMGAFGGDWLRRHKDDMQLQRSAKEMVQRKSREELEMDVHAAFAKTRFWVLAQLQKYLKQPASAVNEIVKEVAIKHLSGPHKGQWELKPEFRAS